VCIMSPSTPASDTPPPPPTIIPGGTYALQVSLCPMNHSNSQLGLRMSLLGARYTLPDLKGVGQKNVLRRFFPLENDKSVLMQSRMG
jgi:hypothetical protein